MKMTTKKETALSWRLKDLPDAVDVAELVDKKIITPVEARSLLFNDKEKTDKDEENKALKEQIKFYEKIIESLSKQNYTNITYTPTYPVRYWINASPAIGIGPYLTLGNTIKGTSAGTVGGTISVNTANLIN